MRSGRIETYVHSDGVTPNKGAAVVSVVCATDFAARTPAFADFARLAARMAFAAQASDWDAVAATFPDVEAARVALAGRLTESVTVADIVLLRL